MSCDEDPSAVSLGCRGERLRTWPPPVIHGRSGPDDKRARLRARLRREGPVAARITVTVAVAWQAAVWAGAPQPPVYAALVPLVALRANPMTAVQVSYKRVLAVMAGVAIGIATLNVLRPSTATLTGVVALGLVVGMFFPGGGSLDVQVAVSSLLVFANPSPDAYALHRLWETALGGLVTIALAPLLWPPHPRRALEGLAHDCRVRLTEALTATAAALGDGPGLARDNLDGVTAHLGSLKSNSAQAHDAGRAMRFNPARRRHRADVTDWIRGIDVAEAIGVHLVALARAVDGFSGREDLATDLRRAREGLRPVADTVACVIDRFLSGQEFQTLVVEARTRLAAYARDDRHPAAVALRRPFTRMIDDLAAAPCLRELPRP